MVIGKEFIRILESIDCHPKAVADLLMSDTFGIEAWQEGANVVVKIPWNSGGVNQNDIDAAIVPWIHDDGQYAVYFRDNHDIKFQLMDKRSEVDQDGGYFKITLFVCRKI